jgi:hypothetical protein
VHDAGRHLMARLARGAGRSADRDSGRVKSYCSFVHRYAYWCICEQH